MTALLLEFFFVAGGVHGRAFEAFRVEASLVPRAAVEVSRRL